MTNKLAIQVKPDAQNVLVGFPMMDDQYYDGSEDDAQDDSLWLYVNLGERNETTAAQEQCLNANEDVISYSVV
jgi:hypothetical protein